MIFKLDQNSPSILATFLVKFVQSGHTAWFTIYVRTPIFRNVMTSSNVIETISTNSWKRLIICQINLWPGTDWRPKLDDDLQIFSFKETGANKAPPARADFFVNFFK